ncbi:Ferritin-1 [Abeliophyllum distichum]|uniref:Ferritin n=1 Tax=Abeliophyllum distichum TaxID=126358 RepID=A0ABD1R8X5_9LAMI
MFLEAISAVSGSGLGTLSNSTTLLSVSSSSNLSSLSSSSSVFNLVLPKKRLTGFAVYAEKSSLPLTGVVFQPFEEVKKDALTVPISPQLSLARQRFSEECEAAINEQINVEYNVSYVYHSMFAYFDRDNVALKGLAKFFKESSEEEREHAEKLMQYQNIRGGRVKLHIITSPPAEFDHVEKGDALYAMELALSLEKLTNEKLLNVHSVADQNNDPQMTDFIESEFLKEQVEAIKKIAEYVTQLRMVGKGHGVWHFDQKLLHNGNGAV